MSRIPSTVQQGPFGTINNAGRRRPRPQPVILLKGVSQGLEHTGERNLDAIQQRVKDASARARANPIGDCKLLVSIAFVAGVPQALPHGLGRTFVSCLLCGQSASGSYSVQRPAALVRPPSPQNVIDERVIIVTTTFTGTADLLVW